MLSPGKLPRGHLEADKEPGHFVGKGYLKLEFDRIGFPIRISPFPAKSSLPRDTKWIVAGTSWAAATRRETPWNGSFLRCGLEDPNAAGRAPRPTMKGEEQITVRLMDDYPNPSLTASGQPYEKAGILRPAGARPTGRNLLTGPQAPAEKRPPETAIL